VQLLPQHIVDSKEAVGFALRVRSQHVNVAAVSKTQMRDLSFCVARTEFHCLEMRAEHLDSLAVRGFFQVAQILSIAVFVRIIVLVGIEIQSKPTVSNPGTLFAFPETRLACFTVDGGRPCPNRLHHTNQLLELLDLFVCLR
jgi:hypothetical protein